METTTYSGYSFVKFFQNDFADVCFNNELRMAVCSARQEYIPISSFKEIFNEVSSRLNTHEVRYFLFDKRNLRTFHQPSMEWYFAVWKPVVKNKGLHGHYKILPQLDWFVKSVEAGKHEIFQKYGSDILRDISVKYVDSVEQAIEDVQRLKSQTQDQ